MNSLTNSFITQRKETSDVKNVLKYIISKQEYYNENVSEACKSLGIKQDQILPKQISDFEAKNISKDSASIRYNHYEARRRARLLVIAEYLVENKFFLVETNKRQIIHRSCSSSSPYKGKYQLEPAISLSPKLISEKRLNITRYNILKRLKVEEKRKKIFEDQQIARDEIDKKLKMKLAKSEKKESIYRKQFFENKDKRIREILSKKYKDLDERESKALNMPEIKREESRSHYFYMSSSPKRYIKVIFKQDTDIDIESKLLKINSKLANSAERAKKVLMNKANSSIMTSMSVQKVKDLRQELDSKREEDIAKRLSRMHKSLIESHVSF